MATHQSLTRNRCNKKVSAVIAVELTIVHRGSHQTLFETSVKLPLEEHSVDPVLLSYQLLRRNRSQRSQDILKFVALPVLINYQSR